MRLQFMGPPGKAGKAGSAGSRQRRDKVVPPPGAAGLAGPAAAAGVDGEEEEDEESHWAQEQIRKGMGGLMRGAEPAAGTAGAGRAGSSGNLLGEGQQLGSGMEPGMESLGGGAAGAGFGFGLAAGGSQAGKINADAEAVLRALQAGLQRLQVRFLCPLVGLRNGHMGS